MLYDHTGKAIHQGTTVKELIWDVVADSAIPSWLSLVGTDAQISFAGPGTSRGACTLSTKADTPTSGDIAGITTAFDIKSDEFEEIGFFVYSAQCDASATQTNHKLQMFMGDGAATGAIMQNTASGSVHTATVFPGEPRELDWLFSLTSNSSKRKDLGIVIRPRKKEVWFMSGDPADGSSPILYDIGNWTNLTDALTLQIRSMASAQRSLTFSKIKLRLCHY